MHEAIKTGFRKLISSGILYRFSYIASIINGLLYLDFMSFEWRNFPLFTCGLGIGIGLTYEILYIRNSNAKTENYSKQNPYKNTSPNQNYDLEDFTIEQVCAYMQNKKRRKARLGKTAT